LLILRRRYTSGIWYIVCVLCHLVAPGLERNGGPLQSWCTMCAQLIPGTLCCSFTKCYSTTGYSDNSFVCSSYNQLTCRCTDNYSCFRPDTSSIQTGTKTFRLFMAYIKLTHSYTCTLFMTFIKMSRSPNFLSMTCFKTIPRYPNFMFVCDGYTFIKITPRYPSSLFVYDVNPANSWVPKSAAYVWYVPGRHLVA
jgi:hypothetical protein